MQDFSDLHQNNVVIVIGTDQKYKPIDENSAPAMRKAINKACNQVNCTFIEFGFDQEVFRAMVNINPKTNADALVTLIKTMVTYEMRNFQFLSRTFDLLDVNYCCDPYTITSYSQGKEEEVKRYVREG